MRNALLILASTIALNAGCAFAADSRPIQSETVWTFDWDGTTFSALATTTTSGALTRVEIQTGGGGGSFDGDAFDVTFTPTVGTDWTTSPDNAGDALDELAARALASETTLAGIMPPNPTVWAVPVINEDADGLTQVDFGYYESGGGGRLLLGYSGVTTGGSTYDYGLWTQTGDNVDSPSIGVKAAGGETTFVQFSSSGAGSIISSVDLDLLGSNILNFGGFMTNLIQTTDYADTAASVSGITMNSDQSANIRAGMLVKITSAGVEYPYRVKSCTSTTLRVLGPDINTAASTVSSLVWSAKTDAIGYMQFQVSGNWCDTTSTSLLADDMGVKFAWPLPSGQIVGVCAVERVATGSPVVDVYVAGSDIMDGGITVGTSWADSEGILHSGASAVAPGDAIEIGCTSGVASGNADLSVGLWYYLTGNE